MRVKIENLTKWGLLIVTSLILAGGVSLQSAEGQITCTRAVSAALRQQNTGNKIFKVADVLEDLDDSNDLSKAYSRVLNSLVTAKKQGANPVVDGALTKFLDMVINASNEPAATVDESLSEVEDVINDLDGLLDQFGAMPEGIFNQALKDTAVNQPTAWIQADLSNSGIRFEIRGYRNLVKAGMLPENVSPVFGKKFGMGPNSGFALTEELECDVFVNLICIDFKLGSGANYNSKSPGKASYLINSGTLKNVWFSVSPNATATQGSQAGQAFIGAINTANAGLSQGKLALIDGGDFGVAPTAPTWPGYTWTPQ